MSVPNLKAFSLMCICLCRVNVRHKHPNHFSVSVMSFTDLNSVVTVLCFTGRIPVLSGICLALTSFDKKSVFVCQGHNSYLESIAVITVMCCRLTLRYQLSDWALTRENAPLNMCVRRRFRSACAFAGVFWKVNNAKFLHVDNKDSRHTGQMRRLICFL